MRSMTRLLALVSMVVGLVAAPVLAAPHGGATKPSGVTAHGQKKTTTTASAPKGPTMKTTTTKSHSTQGPKGQTSTAKGTTMKSTHASSPKKGGSTSGTTTHASASSGKSTKSGATDAPGSGTPSGTWTPDNPVAQKLSTKTNLLNKVQSSLPAGTDLNAATAGFKNFGQFVAAVNVSNNLGIPFADLKASMTGLKMDGTSTGKPTASLGQSIQQLRPGVNAEMEAQKAETEATRQINEKSPATGTTSTTTTKKKSTKPSGSF